MGYSPEFFRKFIDFSNGNLRRDVLYCFYSDVILEPRTARLSRKERSTMQQHDHEYLHEHNIPHVHRTGDTHDEAHSHSHEHGGTHPHVHENTRAVLNRLSRAIGHLESVKKMVESGRDCSEVLIQIAAVRSAINNIGKVILQDHIQHCIVDAVEHDDEQALDDLCQAIDKFIK